jgi:Fe-S-cluster-containing dehydrogenase component
LLLPESLRTELDSLAKESPIGAIKRLNQEGCTLKVAMTWVHHYLQFCKGREACTTPCPYCGKFLRTPRAKQCRFCGADWHDKS